MNQTQPTSTDASDATRAAPAGGDSARFWLSHALWPLGAMLLAFVLIEVLGLDRKLAHAIYYNDITRRWLGGGQGDWWSHRLIHDGGRWCVRSIAACALIGWLLSFLWIRARGWRRTAGFVFVALVLSTGVVGLLKVMTNVDCPWDLAEFGGDRPYVTLFGDRPDNLSRAECFPGAHSSSGFALVCFYFAWRDRSRRKARWALLGGCLVGVLFSFAQEARGAHFLSHDLVSAALVWAMQLGLYARMPGMRAAPA
jgi:membrane-associated PAP2 superfamily phosphatase